MALLYTSRDEFTNSPTSPFFHYESSTGSDVQILPEKHRYNMVRIWGCGGGGGGGGGDTDSGGGGGGGGCSAVEAVYPLRDNAYWYQVVIGAGGSGGAMNIAGTVGGNTQLILKNKDKTVTTTLTLYGGGGGGVDPTNSDAGGGGSGGTSTIVGDVGKSPDDPITVASRAANALGFFAHPRTGNEYNGDNGDPPSAIDQAGVNGSTGLFAGNIHTGGNGGSGATGLTAQKGGEGGATAYFPGGTTVSDTDGHGSGGGASCYGPGGDCAATGASTIPAGFGGGGAGGNDALAGTDGAPGMLTIQFFQTFDFVAPVALGGAFLR